jgi:glutathione peroxidase
MSSTLYHIPLKTISGADASLAEYRGKVLLVVNVASKCGLTPQYEGLEKLYERYRDEGLVVLGFPANDFASQEPGSDSEIESFCRTNFSVAFPMFSKIAVTGSEQHPLYRELTTAKPETSVSSPTFRERLQSAGLTPTPEPGILWNFEKFVVSREGRVVARFSPDTAPDDPRILEAIEAELRKA